jgi:hypothetical protein
MEVHILRRLAIWGSIGIGSALIIVGWVRDGYQQSVLLEVGAAVLLVAPLVFLERLLEQRVDRTVEDRVASTIGPLDEEVQAAVPDFADQREAWEQSLLNELNIIALRMTQPMEVLGRHPDAGNAADGRINSPSGSVIIEMKHRRGAQLSAAVILESIQRATSFEEKRLMVSNIGLTEQAREVLRRVGSPRIAWVQWTGAQQDKQKLEEAVRRLLTGN